MGISGPTPTLTCSYPYPLTHGFSEENEINNIRNGWEMKEIRLFYGFKHIISVNSQPFWMFLGLF